MPDRPLARRLLTTTAVMVLAFLVTLLSPVIVVIASFVDVVRRPATGKSWITLRCMAFLWVYLVGEVWAIGAVFLTAWLPTRLKLEVTFRLQETWAGWNLSALQTLFSVGIDVTGGEALTPGPIVVLSRHASMVDTLLPATLITRRSGLRLRYVLKKELLLDPALDLAGNRLPNAFIDRDSAAGSEDAVRDLARDLGPGDGILIYPEGTRFSTSKLSQRQRRVDVHEGTRSITESLRRVLPPKPGGTLAILDATEADVVVLAHQGLEGLATVREIWSGGLVHSRISVHFWRVPRSEIPAEHHDRVLWLYRLWSELDEWVASAAESA